MTLAEGLHSRSRAPHFRGAMPWERIPKAQPDQNPNPLLPAPDTLHRPLAHRAWRAPICTGADEGGEQGSLSLFSAWSLIATPLEMVILGYSSTSSTTVCHRLGDRMGSGRNSGVSPKALLDSQLMTPLLRDWLCAPFSVILPTNFW